MRHILLVIFLLQFNLVLAEENHIPKIGILIPLSGPYAEMGGYLKDGVVLAQRLYPQVKADFIYSDSKADSQTSVSEFRKLTNQDKIIALYLVRSGVGLAINPLSKELGLPIFGGVAYEDFIKSNPFAYRAWSTADVEGELLAKKVRESGVNSIAIINSSDDYMLSIYKGFEKQSDILGLKHEPIFEFNPDTSDFRGIFPKIRTARPDAILANLSMAHLGIFLKQFKESGISGKIYSNFFVAKKNVIATAGANAVSGITFVEPSTNYPLSASMLKEINPQSEFDALVLSTFTSVALILQTLKDNPAILSSAELQAALVKQTVVNLPDRSLEIIQREIQYPLEAKMIQ